MENSDRSLKTALAVTILRDRTRKMQNNNNMAKSSNIKVTIIRTPKSQTNLEISAKCKRRLAWLILTSTVLTQIWQTKFRS